ncbi:MAG TPA: crosslink repair DNA glycosylase YcaQ family protein [Edaphobacter sp.]|uniref:DNA glycosylase AlkZ-like family protein n=1 Tax=Edaphobacter sp. TaxID=1934404 RepID=UPI002BEEE49B|nr:crosslink repair DNA glycosylase YcaQ family protein [Edaphobacter sp.]HUZ93383.1 crosslink repair DNA glycosylase YcaQ family protein [Edaphobacter sp.]
MPRTSSKSKKVDAAKPSGADAALSLFHPVTAKWFRAVFDEPTAPQIEGWPAIARGESTLILAPTGTGKTLTAFLWCLDQLMLRTAMDAPRGCRVVYLSPLKALAADVERNLRSPLAGISNMAKREGVEVRIPEISVRTGDTSQKERARFRRHPGEILITTPESLYLLLTSEAGESLRTVETVIVDEIHALVPSKRGAHMAVSLERLEALTGRRLQRIGLSATQRPLEEVARFLGGAEGQGTETQGSGTAEIVADKVTEAPKVADVLMDAASDDGVKADVGVNAPRYRPVTVVNAGARKVLELKVEVPVEDMARLGEIEEQSSGPASQGPKRTSIWQSIYPRLLEIVQGRTSTLIFVNARRVAERLAGALNELAGEAIARAHHGSLAAAQRSEIEELLKAGKIKALIATSSLELGIDMGAIDLVIQIEAPPSVASGMQRIGRAGHQVGAPSHGIIFPKYRADLIACAAVTRAMHEGHVESTRFLRNPLDVLAQQMVAVIAHPPLDVADAERRTVHKTEEEESPGIGYEALYSLMRSAAPFAGLSRSVFDGVLDMLAGRYPSDEFAELRPRVTWDRTRNWITPRAGVKRVAILNGGTIPDRGTYGVFLAGERSKPVRVGELDEEMVFESRNGDTFILGASAWRIEEITHDRVLVSPAPGEAGKMPFWHGDRAGRPLEFGRRIGALVRELREMPRSVAMTRLTQEHDLEAGAAENVLRYLADQELATTVVPDDRNIVIERVRDELGDWRVCVLTPFGSRIHAPWAMAATAKIRAHGGPDVETMWSEDGFVLRFPETEEAPAIEPILLEPEEAAELVLQQLGSTALFAAKFRESAARALLLPRRRADGRTPLWQQRKRSYDLLSVASRYPSFPILLEAYRECLRDVFDMPALMETLRLMANRSVRVHTVDSRTPSPFASALLFSYLANYIYDGDAPLAERRAQALSIDQDQLRELMGDADLRELLDANAIEETEEQLQCVFEDYKARTMDGVHDLLLRLGDLTRDELRARCVSDAVAESVAKLMRVRRVLEVQFARGKRLIAVEDAARYRDALGVPLPPGLPTAFLEAAPEAMVDLLRRYARTHGPFTSHEAAGRFDLPMASVEAVLQRLVQSGRIVEGGFRPGGIHREWCDNEVLRTIRRKSLAQLRKEVEPVEQRTLARLLTRWQGVVQPRRGLDALLDVIENLQGAPLPASILETEILPSRLMGYKSSDLDTLIAAGEVVWVGLDPIGERDGRIGLYLAEKLPGLWNGSAGNREQGSGTSERGDKVIAYLRERGASFFQDLHDGVGGGYPGETLDALWELVWKGLVTNDGMAALRAYCERPAASARKQRRVHQQTGFRSRRTTPPTAQGRWALQGAAFAADWSATAWSHAMAQQLLTRYGVVFRETAHAENLPGGFSAIYDVMKVLEESGKIRRGYFAADLGATQFAQPAAVDLLRSLRVQQEPDRPEMLQLAATDPANPYGALLRWPAPSDAGSSLTRSVGAQVILRDGELVAYLRRGNPNVQVFLPEEEPQRSHVMQSLAEFLVKRVQGLEDEDRRAGLLIAMVNGVAVAEHPMARALLDAGFAAGAMGFNVRRGLPPLPGGRDAVRANA